nr:hypothetical protein [Bradyrhizobium diazoefficiens]
MSVGSAEARVGRPLTPVSVAGVSRRHARRAAYGYGYGAVGVGAAAVGTAAAVAATAAYPGWGNAYAAQTDPYFGQPNYIHRAYYEHSPYYGYNGWTDYSGRNGIKCAPGGMTRLDDGHMYVCQ